MAVAAPARPAVILERGQRRWWLCPACKKTLGEVRPHGAVVHAGKRAVWGRELRQRCPECQTVSEYREG